MEQSETHLALDVEAALLVTHRRDYLFRNAPPCPKCQADQVQCTDWQVVPSEWKCRECRFEFLFEPAAGTLAATTLPTNEHDCVAAERELEALRGKLGLSQADAQRKDEALRHFVACVKSDSQMMFYHGNNLFERYADVIAALSVGQQG